MRQRAIPKKPVVSQFERGGRSAGASACKDLAPEHAQRPIAIDLNRIETRNFQSTTDGTFHRLPGRRNFGFQLFREHEFVIKMTEWLIVVRLLKGLDHG